MCRGFLQQPVILGFIFSLLALQSLSVVIKVSPGSGNLREILAEAVSGDVIILLSGIYANESDCNITITATNIMLIGESGPNSTIIDCTLAKTRHMSLLGDNITIDGLQLRGGNVSADGIAAPAVPPSIGDFAAAFDATAPYDTAAPPDDACGGCVRLLGAGATLRNLWLRDCAAAGGGALFLRAPAGRTPAALLSRVRIPYY